MIHYPLTPIHAIFKTEMDTFTGSVLNSGEVLRNGIIKISVLDLKMSEYLALAEMWETSMINEYRRLQHEQFIQNHGEEY